MDAKSSEEPRTGETVESLPEQSPRSRRRDGLLHCPNANLGVLYGFFVIAHNLRRILHFNVTRHPTSEWVAQQLREAFPYESVPGYLIFGRATNFDEEVVETMKAFGITPTV
jgi:hypothetical protein